MTNSSRRNRSLVLSLSAIALGMLMLAYASVPLYRLFCQITGYGGTPRSADAPSEVIIDRTITVRFNADTDNALPWEFKPEQAAVKVKVGENKLVNFYARNMASSPTTGQATFNVTPQKTGLYFVKVQCFCFENQTLQPGQKVDMPVSFYIDPAIMDDKNSDDVQTITLSYTFFQVQPTDK